MRKSDCFAGFCLAGVAGVSAVEVDLAAKTATLTLDTPVENEALAAVVTDAGYTVLSVTEL